MSHSTAFFTSISTLPLSIATEKLSPDAHSATQTPCRWSLHTSLCPIKVSCSRAESRPFCVSESRRQPRSLSRFGSKYERRYSQRKRGYEEESTLREETKLCGDKFIKRIGQVRFCGTQDLFAEDSAEERNRIQEKELLAWPPQEVERSEAGKPEGLRWYQSVLCSLTGFGESGKEPRKHLVEGEESELQVSQESKSLFSSMASLFDLEKQFTFYGSYHSNKINILLHMIFVWPIYYSSLLLYAYLPAMLPFPLPEGTLPFQQYMVLNGSFVLAAIYAVYYVMLDKKAGSIGAALCLGGWIAANAIAQALPWSTGWKIVLLTNIVCWTGQIYGHQKFEGRAPALLDNIFQAFLMAPFFVLLEFLQTFGYEPYPGFKKSVSASVSESIRKFRASKEKKAA